MPAAVDDQLKVNPIYKTYDGWKSSTVGIKNFDDQTLLSINGVGVKSSDILLKRFKDVSRLSKATYEELREVVSDSIARKVYSYFNGDF